MYSHQMSACRCCGKLGPIIEKLPPGYRIDLGGAIEEAMKANNALAALFPVMILCMLTFIMLQVRSFSTMFMVFLTAPLRLGRSGADHAALPFAVRFQRHSRA